MYVGYKECQLKKNIARDFFYRRPAAVQRRGAGPGRDRPDRTADRRGSPDLGGMVGRVGEPDTFVLLVDSMPWSRAPGRHAANERPIM